MGKTVLKLHYKCCQMIGSCPFFNHDQHRVTNEVLAKHLCDISKLAVYTAKYSLKEEIKFETRDRHIHWEYN